MNKEIGDKKCPSKSCLFCNKLHKNKYYCSQDCAHNDRKIPISEERLKKRRLKILVAVRRYQAKKLRQTPDDADDCKIKEIYANCPEGYEVDHRIPISKGGLHHQDNLQYLLMSDNRRKSNKLNWVSEKNSWAQIQQ